MNNLIIAFEVVAPLLIMMLLGIFLKSRKLLTEDVVSSLNQLVFKVFLPVLIFNNVYNSSIEEIKNIRPALFAAAVLAGGCLVSLLIVPLFEKDNKKRGVMVQGIFRSNFVIFGIPLSLSLCGEQILGKVAVEVTVVIPVINILSVVALEIFRGGKPDFGKILIGILKNPLLIGSVLGVAALVSGIKLPDFVSSSIGEISKIATPIALIVLGASINFSTLRENAKQLATVLTGKLILIPLIGFSLAIMLGMPKEDIAVFIAVFASPTAVSSYPMAQQMDGDSTLAAQIVAFSTTICIITVFLWVFILKQLNLI